MTAGALLVRRFPGLQPYEPVWRAMQAADGSDVAHNDVLELLGRLVDKSLVHFEGRFRLIQTIRQFARSELEAGGELHGARLRHTR